MTAMLQSRKKLQSKGFFCSKFKQKFNTTKNCKELFCCNHSSIQLEIVTVNFHEKKFIVARVAKRFWKWILTIREKMKKCKFDEGYIPRDNYVILLHR